MRLGGYGSSKFFSSESELSSSLASDGSSIGSSWVGDSSNGGGSGGTGQSSGSSGSSGSSQSSDPYADFVLAMLSWEDGLDGDTVSYFEFEITNIGDVSFDVTSITSEADPIILHDLTVPFEILAGQSVVVSGQTSPGTPISHTNFTVLTTIGGKFLFVD